MSNQYKIAAKVGTSSTDNQVFYTAPAGKQFISTTLNVSSGEETDSVTYSIGVIQAGEAPSSAIYVVQNATLEAGESHPLKLGITLASGEAIVVKTDGKTANFVLFGAEIG